MIKFISWGCYRLNNKKQVDEDDLLFASVFITAVIGGICALVFLLLNILKENNIH